MRITLQYMAALRDHFGAGQTTLDLPPDVTDSEALVGHLTAGNAAAARLAAPEVRLIVNDRIVTRPSALAEGDQVVFCPPFTGG